MNYFDYWEYDTIDFLKRFIEAELDCLSVKDFLKRFELEHYELSIDLKEAKRILLVYGDSEYSFSSTDQFSSIHSFVQKIFVKLNFILCYI